MGDKNRLQQVLWNLLANAIKFTPKGGRVVVTASRINSHLEIMVSDNGAGIASDFLPHVFERFRQADSTTTRRAAIALNNWRKPRTHGGSAYAVLLVRPDGAAPHAVGEGLQPSLTARP
jgi:signal transduction histidine kinase